MDQLAHCTAGHTEAQGGEATAPGHRALKGTEHSMSPWYYCFSQVPSLWSSGLTHSTPGGEASYRDGSEPVKFNWAPKGSIQVSCLPSSRIGTGSAGVAMPTPVGRCGGNSSHPHIVCSLCAPGHGLPRLPPSILLRKQVQILLRIPPLRSDRAGRFSNWISAPCLTVLQFSRSSYKSW